MQILKSFGIPVASLLVITIVSGELICPPTYGQAGTCATECESDSECSGGKSCCPNGCALTCQLKVESTATDCHGELPPIFNPLDLTKRTCASQPPACPDGSYCDSATSVCCPDAKLSCRGDSKIHPCLVAEERWRFNIFSRKCETFMGCPGEGNNYNTKADCDAKCKPACDGKTPIQTDQICTRDNAGTVCPADSGCDYNYGFCCGANPWMPPPSYATRPSYHNIIVYLSTIVCAASALLI